MRFLRPVAIALGFLTRLPVYPRGEVVGVELGRSLAWFPLAGALLGAILLAAERICRGRLPAPVGAVLLVGLLAWLTAGLHLDGLADLADGLGGGRGDRERALAIMRDSRIGAHGAAALVLVLLLKAAALAELLQRRATGSLLAFPAVARFGATLLVLWFPYARREGLGAAFKRHGRAAHGFAAAAVLAPALAWAGRPSLIPAAAALAAALLLGLGVRARLGGLTGDAYGASIEAAEAAFLVAAVALGHG